MEKRELGKMILRVFTVALLFAASLRGNSQPAGGSVEATLVLARPGKTVLLRTLSSPAPEAALVVGQVFSVTLSSVDVVYGELDVPESLTVSLIASHEQNVTAPREIFLLLAKSEGDANEFDVIAWGVPARVACVPEAAAENLGLGGAWFVAKRGDGSQCVPLP